MIRKLLARVGIRTLVTGNGGGRWLHFRLFGFVTPGIKIPWH